MDFFTKYTSNTLAGSGNQSFFISSNPDDIITGRLFYKIFKGGNFNYSILFSNIIDSTYASGNYSHKNLICDHWKIHSLKIGICDNCSCEEMVDIQQFSVMTFDGKICKTVAPGEFFHTDEVMLDIQQGQYICLEISFSGKMLPCHPETLIPSFIFENGNWIPSTNLPFPGMIGCDRPVKKRIAYLGDSITQGIGTTPNSYSHWNSILSQKISDENAYWNLGLGFGRADDAASDGAWLYKAKQSDIIFLCFGVNDILQNYDETSIINNIQKILTALYQTGAQVILQTVPPFDYSGTQISIWNAVNSYIRTACSKDCYVFDNIPVLCDPEKGSHFARYGGHPNEVGSALWADSLYQAMQENFRFLC